jgi:L-alanine-DL-glutamate epimerase-like enolase superfamily enzyme
VSEYAVHIKEVSYAFEDFRYRTPIKFGGVALDRVTLLNVGMVVETTGGKVSGGFGSMPLGNVWAWPSKVMKYDETLVVMKAFADMLSGVYRTATNSQARGHPIQISTRVERILAEAVHVSRVKPLNPEPIPTLAALVVNSAFDAALHDAYGKAFGLNCYHTYGPPFFDDDLGDYLGAEFKGEKLHHHIRREPQPSLPLYHLVGAIDPLTPAEVTQPVGDGLPEHLGEWITRDGLTHLKIKLNGDDAGWDVARVLGVDHVATATLPHCHTATDTPPVSADRQLHYSLDFNERCQNVEYLLEVLHRVKEQSPAAFARIQYVEQPTARDLKANPSNRMHKAAELVPVVIDESLLDLDTLLLAREQGYSGVAFKACKGQTQSLLLAVAAQKFGLFRCVQDLTCPGASLIHSAGLAAHIPGVAAIEANSRQYCPAANEEWESRFPGVFTIRNGRVNTGLLTGPGLGAVT